jgi:hypothetical protein
MAGSWKLLKSVAVGSGGADSIDTGELGSYDFLKVSVYLIPSGGNIHGYMYFNGDGTSTGNYARRGCSNGGSGSSSGDFEVSPDDEINFTNQVNETCSAFFAIANPASETGKQITGWEQEDGGSDNTTSPDRFEWAFKYKTTGRITSIQVKNNLSGSSNFAEHSYITVWGSSDDTVTNEKDSLTNVPANTRYEETDTRKIYRSANAKIITPNDDYASTSGWTDTSGGDIAIDTTNKGVTYTDVNVGDTGIGKSLGTTLSNSKWLCQFTFQIADWNTNDAGLVSLTDDHTQGFKVSGLNTVTFMPQGTPLGGSSGTYDRFVLLSGQTNSYAEKASPNDKFLANTQYWVDMYRDGSNVKCKVWTNSGRTGTPHWESDNLAVGTNIDGLTGIQHWNENTADIDIGTGWVREVTVYDGTTTQANIVWKERNTA